jgi:hypothetical protein
MYVVNSFGGLLVLLDTSKKFMQALRNMVVTFVGECLLLKQLGTDIVEFIQVNGHMFVTLVAKLSKLKLLCTYT